MFLVIPWATYVDSFFYQNWPQLALWGGGTYPHLQPSLLLSGSVWQFCYGSIDMSLAARAHPELEMASRVGEDEIPRVHPSIQYSLFCAEVLAADNRRQSTEEVLLWLPEWTWPSRNVNKALSPTSANIFSNTWNLRLKNGSNVPWLSIRTIYLCYDC